MNTTIGYLRGYYASVVREDENRINHVVQLLGKYATIQEARAAGEEAAAAMPGTVGSYVPATHVER
jgi:hypothetical protein